MSRVVEHLADLTGFRDRDILDVTLVGALKDLLRPQAAAIFRCVGEEGEQRWLTRARLAPGDITATADPLWADPETLPRLADHPDRLTCLQRQEAFTVDATPAMAYFPLTTDREPVGVLELQTVHPLSYEEVRLVCSILRIYRNFQGLLDYSERDTLTGLLNRKSFDSTFLQATVVDAHRLYSVHDVAATATAVPERRQDGPRRYWLGVIDIDHFKQINDRFGHLVGDEALTVLARLMRSTFRYDDRLYRFGGEEFVVLLSAPDEDSARAAFERFRHAVESHYFIGIGRSTVSIGFSDVRAGDTPQACFDRADKAVYYGKTHGRNQVCSQLALVAAGELEDNMKFGSVELF